MYGLRVWSLALSTEFVPVSEEREILHIKLQQAVCEAADDFEGQT